MIQGMFDGGAMPALERVVQFTEARHRVLTHNVANLSTPYFKPADLDPRGFQRALGEAIERRRHGFNPCGGPLQPRDTPQVCFRRDGMEVRPEATHDSILYHDRNNRDLERIMQRLAENTLTHNASVEMLRSQLGVLQTAIRERV